MFHALIADHMFTLNFDIYTVDNAIIDTFNREDSARTTRSNSRGDRLLLDRKKAEWKRHLATVRSTISEFFLWFILEVSITEIQCFLAGFPLAYLAESSDQGWSA